MYDPIPWEGPLPRHLAMIMDGNGRWAQARGLPRVAGHRVGADTVRAMVRACRRLGIEALTLYAFSAQNWKRPPDEVKALMELLLEYVEGERAEILDNDIRFNCIGELGKLPRFVREPLEELCRVSSGNRSMVLTLALSYGGREEICAAARRIAEEAAAGTLAPDAVDEAAIESRLWTHDLPGEVDLLIRTSGEQRISNFLLWQLAYAELWFTDTPWPELGTDQLFEALRAFGDRERRFGDIAPKGA
ncbi:MAG: di-trans,poly-cis-decaprenylcistransferase [Deltaproteobacteria bacterium]|nr:di-trans,poly-cis-decaprenylcistransferase [Deltaproteobacteria bacterium]MCB9788097.1 di-trans,poly-cis-decaprenylcistransferase [Deltaproteobacteria bacterium]